VRISKGYSLGAVDYLSSPVVPRSCARRSVSSTPSAEEAKRRAEEHLALAEERAARSAAERANALAFLAQASAALSRSFEFDATAHVLMRLAVPFLADAAAAFPGEEGIEAHRARLEQCIGGEPLCSESAAAVSWLVRRRPRAGQRRQRILPRLVRPTTARAASTVQPEIRADRRSIRW
jgi:hypothetical protein